MESGGAVAISYTDLQWWCGGGWSPLTPYCHSPRRPPPFHPFTRLLSLFYVLFLELKKRKEKNHFCRSEISHIEGDATAALVKLNIKEKGGERDKELETMRRLQSMKGVDGYQWGKLPPEKGVGWGAN